MGRAASSQKMDPGRWARAGADDAEPLGDRILKVDHAGEHGAVNIYRAQILVCRWRAPRLVPSLEQFLGHELAHREIFRIVLARRGRRRCRSYALCGVGGFALGLATGFVGASAVAATTVAVERVVLRHLDEQIRSLAGRDDEAAATIARIVADERQHHDGASLELRQGRFWPRVLLPVVSASTEAVIWLGMRV